MKLSTTVSALAALCPAALAAQAYIPIAHSPTNPQIHNKPLAASDGRFYISKPSTAVPPYGADPDLWNTTIITGPTDGNRWWMGIKNGGGQTLFLGKWDPFLSYAKWALGIEEFDGGFLPAYGTGSLQFLVEDMADGRVKLVNDGRYGGALGTPSSNGWSACVKDDFFTVEAGKLIVDGIECFDFELVLEPTDAPAPDYYHYWDER